MKTHPAKHRLTAFTRRSVLLGIITMLGSAFASGPSSSATYGSKVRFAKNVAITFLDFELTYIDRRHVSTRVYPRGFDYDDFKISRGDKSITVTWSPGTGDIGPQMFEFAGRQFTLEMRHADRFKGWLKDDEVVIEKK